MNPYFRKSASFLTETVLLLLVSAALAAAQETAAPPAKPEKPLSAMSEGDLFKKGESDFVAGRFADAREALTLGLAKKKKVDKKYSPMLDQVNEKLADQEAAKGEAACKQRDLVTCEKEVASAKAFAASAASATRLAATFTRTLTEVQDELQAALKLAGAGDYDGALVQLRSLRKYSSHLPSVDADIDRTTKAYVQKVLNDGLKASDEKRWEEGSQNFQHVLEMDKNNAVATSGLKTNQRARSGYEMQNRAQAQFGVKNYAEALKLVDSAISTYPEAVEFEQLKNNIIQNYTADLSAPLAELVTVTDDLIKTKDTYLRIDQIRSIDPGHPSIAKFLGPASENFGATALLKANELENIVDYSKIGTAYAMKLSAKQRLPEGMVKNDDLKTIAAAFNRKRISQLLLSIDNLTTSSAAPFAQTLQTRARSTLESMQLPDLKIRSLEEYQRTPNDDPQFQDLRPDGKTRNVQLTVGVSRYDSKRESGEPAVLRSKYINGIENIPNPEYRAKQEELTTIRRALDKPNQKKDKPTPEGWTEVTYTSKKEELSLIDRTIQKDKVIDYNYTRTEYRQRTIIELSVVLRDYLSRAELKKDPVRYSPNERQGVEIEGVKDTDTNGLQNQRLRLASTEEDLRAAETAVLDELDKKLQEVLPAYTNRFFNEGEKAMRANEPDKAVEAYLCHWAFFRGKLPEAQSDRVVDVVKRETGFDLKREGGVFLQLLDTQ